MASTGWRIITWAGVGLFGLDGLASLLAPSAVAGWVTALTMLTTFVWASLAILLPRVPARIAWPPAMMLIWAALGAVPLSVWAWQAPWTEPLYPLLQIAMAVGLGWGTLRLGTFETRPVWSWGRFLGLASLATVVAPLLVAAYLWTSASWLLDSFTDGYARLTPTGMHMKEQTFERHGTVVHLVGMVHVGDAARYRALYDHFASLPRAVVLAEGVSDRERVMPEDTGYERGAERMGLVQQPSLNTHGLTVRRSDVDLSDLSDETRTLVRGALGVWSAPNPAVALSTFATQTGPTDPKQVRPWAERLIHDLVEVRNERVLQGIAEASADAEFDHIVVPWGALHMPGLDAALRADGWTPGDATSHTLIRFGGS